MTAPALRGEKPSHYKVLCVSLYTRDIEFMDKVVVQLKRLGHTKANRSQLIRAALARLDDEAITEIAQQYGRCA